MKIEDPECFDQIKKYFDDSSFFSDAYIQPNHLEYSISTMPYYCVLLRSYGLEVWHGYWKISMEEFMTKEQVPDDVKLFFYFNIDLWRKDRNG